MLYVLLFNIFIIPSFNVINPVSFRSVALLVTSYYCKSRLSLLNKKTTKLDKIAKQCLAETILAKNATKLPFFIFILCHN